MTILNQGVFFFGCYRNTSRWNKQKEGEESNSENEVKKKPPKNRKVIKSRMLILQGIIKSTTERNPDVFDNRQSIEKGAKFN